MKKRHILLIILLIFLLAFLSDNIIYPYFVIKDFLLSPVHALKEEDIIFDSSYYQNIINSLKEDINELKELNNIKDVLTDYHTINATVIERNRNYWFNTITINKGKIDGIEEDLAVVDKNGLIGRVSKVRRNTADIKLITTNDVTSKISVAIKKEDKDIYGIITGYDNINNLLKINIISKDEVVNDLLVETTGMGGVFPKGILIGKVYDTKIDSDGVSIIVLVRPISNIEKEYYVSVLKRNENNN